MDFAKNVVIALEGHLEPIYKFRRGLHGAVLRNMRKRTENRILMAIRNHNHQN